MSVSCSPPGPTGPKGPVCHGTRRHGILEAPLAVMSRTGFERTSIAAIAGRAGIARATVSQPVCDSDRDASQARRTKTRAAEIGALGFFALAHRTRLARGPPPEGLGERGVSTTLGGRTSIEGSLVGPKRSLRPDPSSTPPRVLGSPRRTGDGRNYRSVRRMQAPWLSESTQLG